MSNAIKSKVFLFIFLLICTSLIPLSAHSAPEVSANIKTLKGAIKILRHKSSKPELAHKGAELFTGDKLIAGDNSDCTIAFTDKSIVKLYSNSEFQLNPIKPKDKKTQSLLLFLGKVGVKAVKTINDKRKFAVITSNAVAGVRGTDFTVAAGEDGTSFVGVNSGNVELFSEHGTKTVNDNKEITVKSIGDTFKLKTLDNSRNWNSWMENRKSYLLENGDKIAKRLHMGINSQNNQAKDLLNKQKKYKQDLKKIKDNKKNPITSGDNPEKNQLDDFELGKTLHRLIGTTNNLADLGSQLKCRYKLFVYFFKLTKNKTLINKFKGALYVKKHIKTVLKAQRSFETLIEEGMKMSINDMEEMIDKMRVIKNKKFEKDNPNNPFKKMENLENNIDFDDDLDSIK